MRHPIDLTPDDNGTILVEFPDAPEAITYGRDEREALDMAPDALEVAFSGYMDFHRPIPTPSPIPAGGRFAALAPPAAMKVELYNSMRSRGVSQVRLAALLNTDAKSVRRLIDLNHASRLDHLLTALAVLGRRVEVSFHDEPSPAFGANTQ